MAEDYIAVIAAILRELIRNKITRQGFKITPADLSALIASREVCRRTATYWQDFLLAYTTFGVSFDHNGIAMLIIRYQNCTTDFTISGTSSIDHRLQEVKVDLDVEFGP